GVGTAGARGEGGAGKTGSGAAGKSAGAMGTGTAAAGAARPWHAQFLIGMGHGLNNQHNQNRADTPRTDPRLHYAYLSGLMGRGGWPDWNANGSFVDILAKPAKDHGVIPMYTLYAMANATNEGNPAVLTDDSWMKPYWDGAKLLFQRLGAFD